MRERKIGRTLAIFWMIWTSFSARSMSCETDTNKRDSATLERSWMEKAAFALIGGKGIGYHHVG